MSSVLRWASRLVVAGAIAVSVAAPVQAAGATPTTIRIVVDGPTETFTTTGGALCQSGDSVSFNFHFGGGNHAGSFHLDKLLTCDSGTLTIHVDAATVFGSPTDQGGWSVVSGTGAYAGFHGGGSLVGTYTDTGIIDLYTGRVTG